MKIEKFEGNGRMSEVVVHNGIMYLSGQVYETIDDDVKKQTECILEIIENFLEKYGSGKNNLLSANIYLKDISLYNKMNEAWDAWVEEGFEPVRTCVEAKMASENFLVEISIVAAVK